MMPNTAYRAVSRVALVTALFYAPSSLSSSDALGRNDQQAIAASYSGWGVGSSASEARNEARVFAPEARFVGRASYHACYQELCEYLGLSEDWDGYGGHSPSQQAIYDALEGLRLAYEKNLPAPRAMVSGSGEVSLYWRDADYYCEMGFAGDGKFYFLAKVDGNKSVGQEEVALHDGIPENLASFLSFRS
jgi:hypothetical protein